MKVNKSNRNKGFRLFKLSERTRKAFVEQKKFRSVLCVTNGNSSSPLHPRMADLTSAWFVQKNVCQKLLFLHQLTHNMYDNRLFIVHEIAQNTCRTCCVHKLLFLFCFDIQNNFGTQHVLQMLRASEKDLTVSYVILDVRFIYEVN